MEKKPEDEAVEKESLAGNVHLTVVKYISLFLTILGCNIFTWFVLSHMFSRSTDWEGNDVAVGAGIFFVPAFLILVFRHPLARWLARN